MSYQNNQKHYSGSGETEYRGRRFRSEDTVSDHENFDVANEYSYRRPQQVQQRGDGRRQYDAENDRRYQEDYDRRPQSYGADRPYRQPYDDRRRGYDGIDDRRYPSQYRGDNYGDSYDSSSGYGRAPQRSYRDRDYGYDNRGYDNRGYDNRGYDNRGYDNRGYDNRGRKAGKKTSGAIVTVRVIAILLLLVGAGIVGYKLYQYFSDSMGHNRLQQLSADYEALYAQNNDFFGWLKIEDTVIDYPVMYSPDEPERYLHMDFDGDYSESGELFMDANCDPNGYHYLIYGHHMFNGSMFGSLPKYEDEDYFNAHRSLTFNTRTEAGTYEIFAVFYSQIYDESEDVFKYYECANLNDEATYSYYVQNIKAMSIYDTGVTPVYGEKIVTLSTCNYHTEDGRFVVAAKKVG